MRSLLLPDLLHGLDELDLDDTVKATFRDLIHRVQLADERVNFARHLLDIGEPRAGIRDRLIVRFCMSRRHAYRVIEEALAAGKTVPSKWHAKGF